MIDKTDNTKGIDTPHRRLYSLIAWTIPVLFLLLVEGLLRLVGFGSDYPLFIELPQRPAYLQPNPEVIKRFFTDPDQAPEVSIDTGYFLAEKPENGLRIVVQGGSSAAGFPYGKNASPAGMLQQRLSRTFPGRPVEVILTAMSAVNTYTLLEFADEIIAIEPDAVLIYAGHNEFIGVLGVGSSLGAGYSPTVTRLLLRLRDLRLFQLVQGLISALKPDAQRRTGTLMATIARERSIPLGSELFERGVTQFRTNLDALLARYAAAGIPVLIGTLASNEKDQAPFMGGTVAADSRGWLEQAATVQSLLAAQSFDEATQAARAWVAIDSGAADAHYRLGQAQLGLAQIELAGPSFQTAIDLDRLRFRAPGVFQSVIRETAAVHGAAVVEVHDQFAAASANGLIGYELMLEHLHPNAAGYFLLADGFYDAMAESGLGLDWKNIVSDDQARAEQPLSHIEKLHGGYRVASLMHDWPFVAVKEDYSPPAPADPEQQIAQDWYTGQLNWISAMNRALVHYQRAYNYDEAARVAINLADAFPFEAQPQHVAGMMLVRQTPPQGLRAIPYFHRAATLAPRNIPFLVTLAKAYLINGFPDAARTTAERVLQLSPGNETALEIIDHLDRQTPAVNPTD